MNELLVTVKALQESHAEADGSSASPSGGQSGRIWVCSYSLSFNGAAWFETSWENDERLDAQT